MPRKHLLLILIASLAALALGFGATKASADTKWHIGDHVEIYDIYTSAWETGVIYQINDNSSSGQAPTYKAHIDGGAPKGSSQADLLLTEQQIRPISPFTGQFKVGSLVDGYYTDGKGRNRGQVIAVDPAGKRYRVHYRGCGPKFDEWLDQSQVKAPPSLSKGSAAVRFLIGRWAMFTPSYPNTVIHGNDVYREYGPGGKAPPLEIKANGTYVWYDEFGKKPARGRWLADAKIPGTEMGTEAIDGVVIKDSHGVQWKAYKWVVKGYKPGIETRQLCSGLTNVGHRIG
jgi:hypothetical protein